AAQRAAGDTSGAAENSRIVQQLIADSKKKMETFKAIPKTTDVAAQRAAGDTSGAAENSRIVQQLIADSKKKMET
ncbi:methyl-accepting chemotaxis protein, partial [Methylobacterium radiotolerans]